MEVGGPGWEGTVWGAPGGNPGALLARSLVLALLTRPCPCSRLHLRGGK